MRSCSSGKVGDEVCELEVVWVEGVYDVLGPCPPDHRTPQERGKEEGGDHAVECCYRCSSCESEPLD